MISPLLLSLDALKSATDDVKGGTLICWKNLARLEAKDDSSDDTDEDLEARHKGKATTAKNGKGKATDASPDPTLVARLPSTGMIVGASPTTIALAAAHQPLLRKRNSHSSTPTTIKKVRHPADAALDDAAIAAKTFIFRHLEQMIPASDFQVMDGTSPSYLLQSAAYHYFQAQLFQAGLNSVIKGWAKATEALKSAREDVVKAFKESEDFHEEAMAHASMHARTIVDQWFEGEVGKQYLLDLGEVDYDMGYQDAQKEIFRLLKARDATFSPTSWAF
nr:MAP7 domain-containing protein 1-like [Ipomoea batatas]